MFTWTRQSHQTSARGKVRLTKLVQTIRSTGSFWACASSTDSSRHLFSAWQNETESCWNKSSQIQNTTPLFCASHTSMQEVHWKVFSKHTLNDRDWRFRCDNVLFGIWVSVSRLPPPLTCHWTTWAAQIFGASCRIGVGRAQPQYQFGSRNLRGDEHVLSWRDPTTSNESKWKQTAPAVRNQDKRGSGESRGQVPDRALTHIVKKIWSLQHVSLIEAPFAGNCRLTALGEPPWHHNCWYTAAWDLTTGSQNS